mmetsp:Transcript_2504/g.3880  ORF Transcript_2504/g.3880 Transcript_2504/m.3880 type:complete len:99 (-) Transcript_2504:698-994(-)|eukprot:CAMPEP_0170488130 /NCGR_PEP_ID=MMETSP0208-20121228/6749_1 /TAXON_ID=197538 /ORGANISM="Strombidium inclinatum, Strain S3" /LENGTH=98 /DNA_ID=CAMNT_0010762601 /DNA_START=172 /DNA_END=468 /DNA_ORIENTATION=+
MDHAYSTNRTEISKVKDGLFTFQSMMIAESQNKSAKGQDDEEPTVSNFTEAHFHSDFASANVTETIFDHSKDNVKVCIRVRPLNDRERQSAQGKHKCV